jgi:hypothetical protein
MIKLMQEWPEKTLTYDLISATTTYTMWPAGRPRNGCVLEKLNLSGSS